MKSKTWRNISIVLVALALIYLYVKMKEARYNTSSEEIFNIRDDQIGQIIIQDGNQQIELMKWDTLWVVTSHEDRHVSQSQLNNLFNTVLGVERESMISDNPERWTTYGVDDSTGRHLKIYDLDGTLAVDMVVGQSSANWQSSYVREAGQDAVYLTTRSIYYVLSPDTTVWLESLPEPEPVDESESEQ